MGVSHKGAISLGLLYIPVGLYTTTRDNDVKFNQLCKDTKEMCFDFGAGSSILGAKPSGCVRERTESGSMA
jgi:hypothetical protein